MKNRSTIRQSIMGLCAGLALCLAALPAQAAVVTYDLNYVFSPTPGPVSPMARVTLTDVGNFVDFTVQNLAGVGTKLDSLYFNFAQGTINPIALAFSQVAVNGTTLAAANYSTLLASTQSTLNPGLKADGDGYFDGKIAYTTNNFLANGSTWLFRLSSTGNNLDTSNFNLLSLPGGGSGSFTMAAHIQALPGAMGYAGNSAWVGTPVPAAPVPLPAAALLFSSGLIGVLAAKGRRLFA